MRYHISCLCSLVSIYFLNEIRTKFEPLSIKGIFVGCNEAYDIDWIYILVQWNKVVSRDVKIDEDMWSSKSHVSPLVMEVKRLLLFILIKELFNLIQG
jgi:hypothetical protein